VLTHEIMNSMTPVTSLAHTAADLVACAERGDPRDLADARVAVETLAGRADGLMQFVETYRQISRAPKVHLRTFAAGPWIDSIAALFRASEIPANLAFDHAVAPPDLTIDGDPDLLSQVLINLLKNAADAAGRHSETPSVSLKVSLARSGKTSIAVSDNGPGVPEVLSQDVFLPFFTTREQGTGVGLSLARQIVLAHHGSIGVQRNAAGGAVFLVVL
jgi:C4-dicarboxylate-specific signal transduction histidine kinase